MTDNSYSQGGAGPSYSYGYGSNNASYTGGQPMSSSPAVPTNGGAGVSPTAQATLRRRQLDSGAGYNNNYYPYNGGGGSYSRGAPGSYDSNGGNNGGTVKVSTPRKAAVKRLDFMFPKVESEYTVSTDSGGITSLIAYGLIAILALSEIIAWSSSNGTSIEHVAIADTSLNKRMRVNLNITFPGLACEDLHVDIMDIAGDSQLDVEDTMTKRRLNRRGMPMGETEILKLNKHRMEQDAKKEIQTKELPADYCGPCYGADALDDSGCCNTCDALIEAYKKKRWRHDVLIQSAEQCIREGKDKLEPKRMKHGEGCNLSGFFNINRVGGNFHIAMGEGIERDGRHIHTFNPDDTHNFNASHTIHHLSFGPEFEDKKKKKKRKNNADEDRTTLNGLSKIVDKSYGTTGLFQYFIKVVPTTYMSDADPKRIELETNRYFFTERFRPLMKELIDDDAYFHDEDEEDVMTDDEDPESGIKRKEKKDQPLVAVKAGHTGSHGHKDHHDIKNAVLPGVFFIYEIYPFNVEISNQYIPFTHLLIRLMATIGGIFTIMKWIDSIYYTIIDNSSKRQYR